MMISLLLALALLTQTEPPPRPQDPNGRPERRDPFEGPRQPQPPTPPQPPRGERRPVQPPGNAEDLQSWLRENEPETFRRLQEFQQEGRRLEVQRMLEDASTRMRELAELKQRDPKGYEKMMDMRRLERQSIDEAEAARRAGPEEREAAMKKLKETLGKLFDAREEIRVRELAEMKRRVEALEKALTNRKAAKDRLVEKRSRELMGEKSDEDW